MASSNFKVFAEGVSGKDIQSDAVYETDTQRVTGVVPGVADPKMHNKLYKQATVMVAALAQVIAQAGFDARDDDYSGLVDGIRKTFAGSVNNVKPDSTGNVDLTEVIDSIRRMTYPRIGDFIITKNPENPSKKYDGTTWELLEEKVFIMSAGSNTSAGEISGNNYHTLTVNELPSHSHSGSIGYAGSHSHNATTAKAGNHYHTGTTGDAGNHYHTGNGWTSEAGNHSHGRGTMNITGFCASFPWRTDNMFASPTWENKWENTGPTGAFYESGWARTGRTDGREGPSVAFDASRSWTGSTSSNGSHSHSFSFETSYSGSHRHNLSISYAGEHSHSVSVESAGNHNHTLTIGNTGNGSSIDMRPRHISAYIWIRTA